MGFNNIGLNYNWIELNFLLISFLDIRFDINDIKVIIHRKFDMNFDNVNDTGSDENKDNDLSYIHT